MESVIQIIAYLEDGYTLKNHETYIKSGKLYFILCEIETAADNLCKLTVVWVLNDLCREVYRTTI